MSPPPFLVGAALLFWGWQAGWWWVGGLAAVVMESSQVIRARWNFPQADLNRIWNLCVLLFVGTAIFAFTTHDGVDALTSLLRPISLAARSEALNRSARWVIPVFLWLPLPLLPMALAQAFSQRERIDWCTFSWWLRRQRARGHTAPGAAGLNVAWPYFAICLLAASAANERALGFPIGLLVLVGWALWARRPRSVATLAWAGCWLLAVGLGFVAQTGLRELQRLAQDLDSALVSRFARSKSLDPKESRTMLGAVGR
ncbi:MAG TPA: hypothetical protein VEO53_16510, partial [Candidatus Binatia bacterium]|nr:hypothetical protein [Candidatus Binatia bacterium]